MPGLQNRVFSALLVVAALTSGVASAAGDPERGEVLADTCMGCHGIAGYRNAYPSYRVPQLGGQHEEYIVIALQGYKNQMRDHDTMHAQAADLAEQDMRDLAAFFASQGEVRQSDAAGGAMAGKDKVAVCTACHGPTGISPAGTWPTLAGQHRDYLEEAIGQYQSGARQDPVMAGLVTQLTEQDIEDIAAFYAAQSGLFTVKYTN